MILKVVEESGYGLSIKSNALRVSSTIDNIDTWWVDIGDGVIVDFNKPVCKCLSCNPSLKHINIWLEVQATRTFWYEFESFKDVTIISSCIKNINHLKKWLPFTAFKQDTSWVDILKYNLNAVTFNKKVDLPDGYLEYRLITINYHTLANVLVNKSRNKSNEWNVFIDTLMDQLEHPELLQVKKNDN